MSEGCFTITLVIDGGANALHRVTSVLAHQRTAVGSLQLRQHHDDARLRDITMTVDVDGAAAGQLVERLRRLVPVRAASVAEVQRDDEL